MGTWATSTIAYMTWILITREKANAEIAFVWLALPALIALITTAQANVNLAFLMLAIGAFVLAAMIMGVKILYTRQSV